MKKNNLFKLIVVILMIIAFTIGFVSVDIAFKHNPVKYNDKSIYK